MILLLLALALSTDPTYRGDDAGSWNVVVGTHAGALITTGSHNIIIGSYAGQDLSTESYWLVLGEARWEMTHEQWCTAYGALAPLLNLPSNGKVCR